MDTLLVAGAIPTLSTTGLGEIGAYGIEDLFRSLTVDDDREFSVLRGWRLAIRERAPMNEVDCSRK